MCKIINFGWRYDINVGLTLLRFVKNIQLGKVFIKLIVKIKLKLKQLESKNINLKFGQSWWYLLGWPYSKINFGQRSVNSKTIILIINLLCIKIYRQWLKIIKSRFML